MSVPSAVSHSPAATAAAEPDEEPPGTRSGARVLSGVPSNAFSPRMPSETSSVMVLPISVAPASSSVCTAQACRVGTGCVRAQSWLPPPVGWPATSNRSFAAKVRPRNGPCGAPSMVMRGPGMKALIASVMRASTVLWLGVNAEEEDMEEPKISPSPCGRGRGEGVTPMMAAPSPCPLPRGEGEILRFFDTAFGRAG